MIGHIWYEQLCDWTHLASAFFRGHGKGPMHTSEYFQARDVLKYAFFFNVKILEANGQKLSEHHIHFFALIRNEIQKIFLFKLVVRNALLHTRDACCTLCCGRTAKPLFHEVETLGLWICLGW